MAEFQPPPFPASIVDSADKASVIWFQWFQEVAQRLSFVQVGTGDPTGVVAAPVGTLFLRLDGGAGTTLYVKEAGTGTAGWAAK